MIGFLISLAFGALAGYIATIIMNKQADRPVWQYLLLGIIGSIVGHIFIPIGGIFGYVVDIAGACLVIFLADKFLNGKK